MSVILASSHYQSHDWLGYGRRDFEFGAPSFSERVTLPLAASRIRYRWSLLEGVHCFPSNIDLSSLRFILSSCCLFRQAYIGASVDLLGLCLLASRYPIVVQLLAMLVSWRLPCGVTRAVVHKAATIYAMDILC